MQQLKILLSDYPFKVVFKNRTPDPGVCTVLSINWRDKRLEVSNGAVTLFPDFSEVVEIVDNDLNIKKQ